MQNQFISLDNDLGFLMFRYKERINKNQLILQTRFENALKDQNNAEILYKTLIDNIQNDISVDISEIMISIFKIKFPGINYYDMSQQEQNTDSLKNNNLLTLYQKYKNLKIILFGNSYQQYSFKLYGDDQIMSIKNWNQLEEKMNSLDKISKMEDNLRRKSNKIFLKNIADNLRKRLASQQGFQGLCNLNIFIENKNILQPRDRDFLTLLSSEINQNDSKNVFTSYGSIPGFTLPFMHKNDDPDKITIEMNSVMKYMGNEKQNLVIIHKGEQQNDLINQIFPPASFPYTDNQEDFYKGIDFLPCQKQFNLGFNIFNLNYDVSNEQDQKEIIKFLQFFPKQGLTVMLIAKTPKINDPNDVFNTFIQLTEQLEQYQLFRNNFIIIHSLFDQQIKCENYSNKQILQATYQCKQLHFIPEQLDEKKKIKFINTATKEIIENFQNKQNGPKILDYEAMVMKYKQDNKYIAKIQSQEVSDYQKLFKKSFEEIDCRNLDKINLHSLIFKGIHYRNLIQYLENDLNNIIISPNFDFSNKDDPNLQTCIFVIDNIFPLQKNDFNTVIKQKNKSDYANLVKQLQNKLQIMIENLKKKKKLHNLIYAFSIAVMNSDSALISTFQDCLVNWQKPLLSPLLKKIKKYEIDIQNKEAEIDVLEKQQSQNQFNITNKIKEVQNLKIHLQKLVDKIDQVRISIEHFWRELIYIQHETQQIQTEEQYLNNQNQLPNIPTFQQFLNRFTDLVLQGIEFELIDGDLTYINVDFLTNVFKLIEQKQANKNNGNIIKTYTVSIIGPQSTGKSTLINTLFGTNFQMSAGRCTRGMYASLKFTDVENARNLLLLDSEGLLSIQKGDSKKFDHLMTVMAMTMSNVLLVNVKGEMDERMKQIIELALYSAQQIKLCNLRKPTLQFILRDMNDSNKEYQIEAIKKIQSQFDNVAKLSNLKNCKNLIEFDNEKSFTLMMPAFYNKKYPDEGQSFYEWNIMSNSFIEQSQNLLTHILSKPNSKEFNPNELTTLTEFIKDSYYKIESIQSSGDLMSLNSVKEVQIKKELSLVVQILINTFVQQKNIKSTYQEKQEDDHQTKTIIQQIKDQIKSLKEEEITLYHKLNQKLKFFSNDQNNSQLIQQQQFDKLKQDLISIQNYTVSIIRKYFFNFYDQRNDIEKDLKQEYEKKIIYTVQDIVNHALDQIEKLDKDNNLIKQSKIYYKKSQQDLQNILEEYTINQQSDNSKIEQQKDNIIKRHKEQQENNKKQYQEKLQKEQFSQQQILDKVYTLFKTSINQQYESKIINNDNIHYSQTRMHKNDKYNQCFKIYQIIQKYQDQQNFKKAIYIALEGQQYKDLLEFKNQILDTHLKMNQKEKIQQTDNLIQILNQQQNGNDLKKQQFDNYLKDLNINNFNQETTNNSQVPQGQDDSFFNKISNIAKGWFKNKKEKKEVYGYSFDKSNINNQQQIYQYYQVQPVQKHELKFRNNISKHIEDHLQEKVYLLFMLWVEEDFIPALSELQFDENKVDRCDDMTVSKLMLSTNKIEDSYQNLLDKIYAQNIEYINQGILEKNIVNAIFYTIIKYIDKHRKKQINDHIKKFNKQVEQNIDNLPKYLESFSGDNEAAQNFIQSYIQNLRQQIAENMSMEYLEKIQKIEINPTDLTKKGEFFIHQFNESVKNGINDQKLMQDYATDIKLFTTNLIQFYKNRFKEIFDNELKNIRNDYILDYYNQIKSIENLIIENLQQLYKTLSYDQDSFDNFESYYEQKNNSQKYEIFGQFLYSPISIKNIIEQQLNIVNQCNIKEPQNIYTNQIQNVFKNTKCPAGISKFESFLIGTITWIKQQYKGINQKQIIDEFLEQKNENIQEFQTNLLLKALGCSKMCPYCGAKCEEKGCTNKHQSFSHRLMGFKGCHQIDNDKKELHLINDLWCDGHEAQNTFWNDIKIDLQNNQSDQNELQAANILQRITGEGGNVGALTFTLEWQHNCDLDIHVTCSHGKLIYFGKKKPCEECDGELDIDMLSDKQYYKNTNGQIGQIENICFNQPQNQHKYNGKIHYYSGDNTPVDYKLTIHSKSQNNSKVKILQIKEGRLNPQDTREILFSHQCQRYITFEEHQKKYFKEWSTIQLNKENSKTIQLNYKKFIDHPIVKQILIEANQLQQKQALVKQGKIF